MYYVYIRECRVSELRPFIIIIIIIILSGIRLTAPVV
jgi:hypothetical protein